MRGLKINRSQCKKQKFSIFITLLFVINPKLSKKFLTQIDTYLILTNLKIFTYESIELICYIKAFLPS